MPAFSETASNVLGHHRVAVCFHFCTSEVKSRQEDTIELKQFNVKISWLIIVDKTTWNFKLQKNLKTYLYI